MQNWEWKVKKMRDALTLIEHKADQALQEQYTHEQILGMILKVAREALLIHTTPCACCNNGDFPVLNPGTGEYVHVVRGNKTDIPCWNPEYSTKEDMPYGNSAC